MKHPPSDSSTDYAADDMAGRWAQHEPLHLTLLADPDDVRRARAVLSTWFDQLAWPPDAAQDVILAVSEAVSNAVEHAYPIFAPGHTVDIHATTEPARDRCGRPARQVRVEVCDNGRWKPFVVDLDDLTRPRGRGLALIEALMANADIITPGMATPGMITPGMVTGTRVSMLSHPVAEQV